MTAQGLFDLSVGVMGISPANATSYADTIITQINAMLADTFALNNNNRLAAGLTELSAIPVVSALGDTLTYQDNILRNVLPWGVAQQLSVGDDEFARANYFGDKYETAKRAELKWIDSTIMDWASGEE